MRMLCIYAYMPCIYAVHILNGVYAVCYLLGPNWYVRKSVIGPSDFSPPNESRLYRRFEEIEWAYLANGFINIGLTNPCSQTLLSTEKNILRKLLTYRMKQIHRQHISNHRDNF